VVHGSHIDLAAAEVELVGVVGREVVLRDKLLEDAQAADAPPFDFLLIDCPPSLGILTLNALAAVEEVFLPLQPHFLALHGLSKLLETIDLVAKRINERLRLSGIVFCLYESGTRLAGEVGRDVEAYFEAQRGKRAPWADVQMFATRIRRNIRLAEAPSFGQSIFQYAPDSHGAADYQQLAEEVIRGQGSGARGQGSVVIQKSVVFSALALGDAKNCTVWLSILVADSGVSTDTRAIWPAGAGWNGLY